MRSSYLKLVVAILTFGIGVVIDCSLIESKSVDKRFATALHLSYPKITEEICNVQSLTTDRCEKLKARISKENDEMVAKDIANTELGCKVDNLSGAECAQRKENAIKDIENNVFSKHN